MIFVVYLVNSERLHFPQLNVIKIPSTLSRLINIKVVLMTYKFNLNKRPILNEPKAEMGFQEFSSTLNNIFLSMFYINFLK